jgi:hypothetical protein
MLQTKIQKVLALVALTGLVTMNTSSVFAVQIGTGSVVDAPAFNAVINWNDTFPGTASGRVQNILIKARVQPSLNMSFSTGTINLGTLSAGVAATGSLFIEIGTNAKSGVSITARSQSGGLTHTSLAGTQINNLTTDGLAESYTWGSTPNATDDSANPAFAAENTSGANPLSAVPQVNGNLIEYNVYTTNKSEALNLVDDVRFTVSAIAGAETPAGDYEDRVTFTVTGNF